MQMNLYQTSTNFWEKKSLISQHISESAMLSSGECEKQETSVQTTGESDQEKVVFKKLDTCFWACFFFVFLFLCLVILFG